MKKLQFVMITLISTTIFLISCNIPANRAPWPVTGPITDQDVNVGESFDLIITGDSGIISNPAEFDPDGDPVSFIAVLDRIDGDDFSKAPVISISSSGVFSVISKPDPTVTNFYTDYSISTTDGSLTTAPTTQITVFYY